MNFGGTYNGGKTRLGTRVTLNIYDLTPANAYLSPVGIGLFHTGVEILGSEYSFASGVGIFQAKPKVAVGAVFKNSLEMGSFDGGIVELNRVVRDLENDYKPYNYDIIERNCNHFCNHLIHGLLRCEMPSYLNRSANIGFYLSCILPLSLLRDGPNNNNDSGNANVINSIETSTSTFSGEGVILGDSSNEMCQSKSHNGGSDDLMDRREKARKAAMLRMGSS